MSVTASQDQGLGKCKGAGVLSRREQGSQQSPSKAGVEGFSGVHVLSSWENALLSLTPLFFWLPGEQVFAGLEEQARQAMMKTDFPGALGDPRPAIHQLQDHDSSSSEFCTVWAWDGVAGGRSRVVHAW